MMLSEEQEFDITDDQSEPKPTTAKIFDASSHQIMPESPHEYEEREQIVPDAPKSTEQRPVDIPQAAPAHEQNDQVANSQQQDTQAEETILHQNQPDLQSLDNNRAITSANISNSEGCSQAQAVQATNEVAKVGGKTDSERGAVEDRTIRQQLLDTRPAIAVPSEDVIISAPRKRKWKIDLLFILEQLGFVNSSFVETMRHLSMTQQLKKLQSEVNTRTGLSSVKPKQLIDLIEQQLTDSVAARPRFKQLAKLMRIKEADLCRKLFSFEAVAANLECLGRKASQERSISKDCFDENWHQLRSAPFCLTTLSDRYIHLIDEMIRSLESQTPQLSSRKAHLRFAKSELDRLRNELRGF
jgi:hypothetical protein